MRTNKFTAWILSALSVVAVSCSDKWDDHYDVHDITSVSADIEVYSGDVVSYLKSQPTLSEITELFEKTGIMETLPADGQYTLIVCENDNLDMSKIENDTAFVKNSISDTPVSPDKFAENFGILTRYETLYDKKNLRVYLREEGTYIDDYKLYKQVKTDNGYVYYIDGTIIPRESVYEYLKSLGEDYSLFKDLVARYEEEYFDRENSTPDGVDDMGNTYYSDSVISVRNTVMDRYTQNGIPYWNMRSENFTTTMFVPNNALIEKALNDAYTNLPIWLNRAVTAADTAKFEKWIVEACFANRRLSREEVSVGAPDFYTVGGYLRTVEEAQDLVKYRISDSAYWRTSVQLVDPTRCDTLSNGLVYYLTDFKIPNHVVIYRVKTRLYEIWNEMSEAQKSKYFRWTNWENPLVVNDAQTNTSEELPTLPIINYHVLTAVPTQEAILAATATDSLAKSRNLLASAEVTLDSLSAIVLPDSLTQAAIDSLTLSIDSLTLLIPQQELFAANVKESDYLCSVEYDGLLYNSSDRNYGLVECNLPAGEYNLRMGFKHSLTYSLSIYFNDRLLVQDMSMAAQGANFHFDRGGASEMTFYGPLSVTYPEGFDPMVMYELYPKSVAYDTDGYQVAVVNIPQDGNFRIRVESSDMASIITSTKQEKKNLSILMMYHWCLRPTVNNY